MNVSSQPPSSGFEITPADTDFPNDAQDRVVTTRGIYVGTGGNVRVSYINDGPTVNFINVQDGTVLPGAFRRVHATGTTATDIVGLF